MDCAPASAIGWLFDWRRGASDRLIVRWLFLRGLGAIYFSAFFPLLFQIRGLIGPEGILLAGSYLQAVTQALGHWQRLWYVPTVLWWSSGSPMLIGLCWDSGVSATGSVSVATWHAGDLSCLLSVVCERGAGFLRLPVRWDVAGGWSHRVFLCAARVSSGIGSTASAFARQSLLAAMGVVSDLL